MTSGDVAVIVGAVTTLITAGASAVTLIRRNSGELSKKEERENDEQATKIRRLTRIMNKLRQWLADNDIPEPEWLENELAGRRTDEEKE